MLNQTAKDWKKTGVPRNYKINNVQDFKRSTDEKSCLKIDNKNIECCDPKLDVSNCYTKIGEKIKTFKNLLNESKNNKKFAIYKKEMEKLEKDYNTAIKNMEPSFFSRLFTKNKNIDLKKKSKIELDYVQPELSQLNSLDTL